MDYILKCDESSRTDKDSIPTYPELTNTTLTCFSCSYISFRHTAMSNRSLSLYLQDVHCEWMELQNLMTHLARIKCIQRRYGLRQRKLSGIQTDSKLVPDDDTVWIERWGPRGHEEGGPDGNDAEILRSIRYCVRGGTVWFR